MSAEPVKSGSGIPRLQELGFLSEAMLGTADNGTFDEVRGRLIAWMERKREGEGSSGQTVGIRRRPGAGGKQESRYMDNARDALAELMRLGLVERATLPTTPGALAVYRNRRYAPTEQGERWVEQLTSDSNAALQWLFDAMWREHPQFRGYYALLEKQKITVPTLAWTELFAEGAETSCEDHRARYVSELAALTVQRATDGDLGWRATVEEIVDALELIPRKRIASAEKRRRTFPYRRAQDFTRDCHKGLVPLALEKAAGIRLDFTSHEILRRWGREFGVANFSYHVPGFPALRCWGTATFDVGESGLVTKRRQVVDFGDAVIAALPEAYAHARERRGGGGFVPVFEVRQDVCWRLGLNRAVFDAAVRKAISDSEGAGLTITLDRATAGTVPMTEAPLRLQAGGRISSYGLIMITPTRGPIT